MQCTTAHVCLDGIGRRSAPLASDVEAAHFTGSGSILLEKCCRSTRLTHLTLRSVRRTRAPFTAGWQMTHESHIALSATSDDASVQEPARVAMGPRHPQAIFTCRRGARTAAPRAP